MRRLLILVAVAPGLLTGCAGIPITIERLPARVDQLTDAVEALSAALLLRGGLVPQHYAFLVDYNLGTTFTPDEWDEERGKTASSWSKIYGEIVLKLTDVGSEPDKRGTERYRVLRDLLTHFRVQLRRIAEDQTPAGPFSRVIRTETHGGLRKVDVVRGYIEEEKWSAADDDELDAAAADLRRFIVEQPMLFGEFVAAYLEGVVGVCWLPDGPSAGLEIGFLVRGTAGEVTGFSGMYYDIDRSAAGVGDGPLALKSTRQFVETVRRLNGLLPRGSKEQRFAKRFLVSEDPAVTARFHVSSVLAGRESIRVGMTQAFEVLEGVSADQAAETPSASASSSYQLELDVLWDLEGRVVFDGWVTERGCDGRIARFVAVPSDRP